MIEPIYATSIASFYTSLAPTSRENLGVAADLAQRNRLLLGAAQQSDAAEANELGSDSKKDIADCFLRLAELPNNLGARYRVQIREPFSERLVAIRGHVITDFEHEYG